jgi:heme/copper-type cytochrome/quinol oxidase subunit 2
MNSRTIVLSIIYILLIVVFTYSAMDKFWDFTKFQTQLGLSPLIPNALTRSLAWTIPIVLLTVAGLLAFSTNRLTALRTYGAILLAFILYIIAILTVSPFVPCSCIGISDRFTWHQQLYINIALLLLIVVAIYLEYREQKHLINDPHKAKISN